MPPRRFKLLILVAILLAAAMGPMNAPAAEKVRFRHAKSLYEDGEGIGLRQPQGVACTENSVLVVADTGNDRLLRYTFSDYDSNPKVQVLKTPLTIYPKRIRMNRQGEIYLLDAKAGRIVRLSAQGQNLGFIEPAGLPTPARIEASSFAVAPDGSLYFVDILSKRVLICDERGQYIKHVQFPETNGWISDIAVNERREIFLVDSVNARVFKARSGEALFSALSESLEQYMRFPTDLAIDQRGRIYLSDRNGSKIVVLSPDGAYVGRFSDKGWKDGLLNHPSQVCLNERGDLFVADTSNHRVQIFVELK